MSSIPIQRNLRQNSMPVAGMERASSLYDKMILDFGDDSVAQLGVRT